MNLELRLKQMDREKKMKEIRYILTILLLLLLIGCGDNNSSSIDISNSREENNSNIVIQNIVGYFIDAPVSNMPYSCGNISDKTDINGKFECPELPVIFKVGNVRVGSIDTLPSDGKVFPQDLAKVSRSDFTNPKVLKIASFLQSLNTNRGSLSIINIPDNFEVQSPKDLDNISQNEINQLLEDNNIKPVIKEEVERHLENILLAENILVNNIPTATPLPTPRILPTPITTPSLTPTILPTILPTPIVTPTSTPTPIVTPSPIPTILPTPIATPTPTILPTSIATPTPTILPTPTATPMPTPTILPTLIFQKAVNNIGDITTYSYISNNKNYTVTVYANQTPTLDNSLSTIAIYGFINSFNTGANLKINYTYPTDTKFKVKVFDSNNNLLGESSILDYNSIAIDYGVINFTKI